MKQAVLATFSIFMHNNSSQNHGRTGRKKLGGRKEICPTFSDCARVVKENFPEKLSRIVVDRGGGRGRSELHIIVCMVHVCYLFIHFSTSISVEFLTNLYIDGEKTFSKTEVGKIVDVKVEREQYTFSPEAKSLFAEINDNWEMNVCKKFQSDVLLSGSFQ